MIRSGVIGKAFVGEALIGTKRSFDNTPEDSFFDIAINTNYSVAYAKSFMVDISTQYDVAMETAEWKVEFRGRKPAGV